MMKNKSKIVIFCNVKFWYLNDQKHRINGPAVEYPSGSKEWWIKGKLHREDGPACEYVNGDKYWFLNGIEVKEEEVMNYKITEREYLKFVISL